ncbi:hypothetical protein IFM89_030507 [Coptis chinensis]|uniref:Uncharacterized protein n=1 Tax=Coptis chinensis TaxID=261450 RepID=A0A835LTB1_9MAGN|nr:hypothetical protein IFM89_030507 [Coptis chinensis]
MTESSVSCRLKMEHHQL